MALSLPYQTGWKGPAYVRPPSETPPIDPPPTPEVPVDLYSNPLSAAGATHIPIGTGAIYAPANDPATVALTSQASKFTINRGYPFGANFMRIAEEDPVRSITWNGNLSGFGFGGGPISVKVPEILSSWWNPSFPNNDNCTVLYDPETGTVHDFYQFNPLTFRAAIYRNFPITGPGHAVTINTRIGPSAIGSSRSTGCLRAHEILTPGLEVTHGYFFACMGRPGSHQIILSRMVEAPACSGDNFAGVATNNTGAWPYGGLGAIPPESKGGPVLETLGLTEAGYRCLALPLRRYGMRPQDDGSTINIACDRKQLPSDGVASGLLETRMVELIADMKKLIPYIRRVTNAVTFTGTPASIAIGSSSATGDIGTLNGDPIGGGTAIDNAPNTGYVAP